MTIGDDPVSRAFTDGSYEGVKFPITNIRVNGGHRLVRHKSWRTDGVSLEHTGRGPYEGSFTIPYFDKLSRFPGLFPDGYRAMIKLFERVPIGRLVLPTHGELRAGIEAWPVTADPEQRSGVMMEVTFVEDNASLQLTQSQPVGGVQQPSTPDLLDSEATRADGLVDALFG